MTEEPTVPDGESSPAADPPPVPESVVDAPAQTEVAIESAFMFTPEREEQFQEYMRRYPDNFCVIMPTLWLCQEQWGWLKPGLPEWVAERLEVPISRVYELITFYTMYYLKDPGRHNLQVCRNISCHLMGAQRIVQHIKDRLGIQVGETSEDGQWRLEEAECLGACGYAPMMQVGKRYYENLTPQKVDALIDEWSQS